MNGQPSKKSLTKKSGSNGVSWFDEKTNDLIEINVQFGLFRMLFVEFRDMSFFADFDKNFDKSGKAIPFPILTKVGRLYPPTFPFLAEFSTFV
ncbi:hypothetical protein OUZ56_000319 [Daphnia magna]|uniref:Uncharacterized protein n=1 Tax=Daphnia magna TaxID=35525 RepID=A0ABR0A017_9CRUS|nr:hypothetical protein OUZ56_000319 [Daphnia magna]